MRMNLFLKSVMEDILVFCQRVFEGLNVLCDLTGVENLSGLALSITC